MNNWGTAYLTLEREPLVYTPCLVACPWVVKVGKDSSRLVRSYLVYDGADAGRVAIEAEPTRVPRVAFMAKRHSWQLPRQRIEPVLK